MSKDGIIIDYRQPVKLRLHCYTCGNRLDPKDPSKNHVISADNCSADAQGYGDHALKIGWGDNDDANIEV